MYIGTDVDRVDALEKVLGRPVFAFDRVVPGALFAAAYRSTRPHARIGSVDTTAARAMEGVVAVLSSKDIPGENRYGAIKKDQPCLAEDRVRFAGEPILLVVAQSESVARRALAEIAVEYEELAAVVDPFAAETSAVFVHEDGNLLSHRHLRKGDAEKWLAGSDIVITNRYQTTWLDHCYMETEAGFGYRDEKGRIVVVSSTQNIHYKMKEICRLLGLPEEKVRVIQAETGGGFGGKLDVTVELFVALAVHHTGRPVVMRFTREESLLSNTKRHPLYIEYTTGADKDGLIRAVKANIIGDTGPYISYGETVCLRAAIHATGPYEVPNVLVDSRMFYTNNPVSGAMRGFGIPQLAFAHESQMDEVARLLNMDPFDVRLRNALRKGSLTATGQRLGGSVGLGETLRTIEPQWRRREKIPGAGFGLGCMYYGCGNTGISNPAAASVAIGDGAVTLYTGACEIGQGSDTVLLQILQETLGVEMSQVRLVRGDTDSSKDAGSSSASRQTYISGAAVMDGALKARRYLEEKGFYEGRVLGEICGEERDKGRLIFEGFFDPPTTAVNPQTSQGKPYATYAFATHMTEVKVEKETGCCRVRKVYAAHDVGRAINAKNIRGQICGGVAMGIGLALMEEFIPGKTESLDSYYIPTAKDMPEVEAFIVEDPEPTGPFGAKGVGEPALIPQAASIVNAIADATGVRPFDLPCHMERLKGMLEKAEAGKRRGGETEKNSVKRYS